MLDPMSQKMSCKTPKGAFDLLPFKSDKEPWQQASIFAWVESLIREVALSYGFKELRTPIFESTELFTRSVGTSSEIVQKEMYTFLDRSDRSMTLRPEGTATYVRSYIEHQYWQHPEARKVFYLGPYFRYERPQKGRYRVFHQAGFEIGQAATAEEEAELILLAFSILRRFGAQEIALKINSIGEKGEKEAYCQALKAFLSPKIDLLSSDSQLRLESNPLRILDSKDENDRALLKEAPKISEFLTEESKKEFKRILDLLDLFQIRYEVDLNLVRGLDYYNRTVFEMTSSRLGAQSSVLGGGRYDSLVESLGGPKTRMCGFAIGIERLILSLGEENLPKEKLDLVLIPTTDLATEKALIFAEEGRSKGLKIDLIFGQSKVQKGIEKALKLPTDYWIILGDDEIKSQHYKIKHLDTKKEIETEQPIEWLLEAKRCNTAPIA